MRNIDDTRVCCVSPFVRLHMPPCSPFRGQCYGIAVCCVVGALAHSVHCTFTAEIAPPIPFEWWTVCLHLKQHRMIGARQPPQHYFASPVRTHICLNLVEGVSFVVFLAAVPAPRLVFGVEFIAVWCSLLCINVARYVRPAANVVSWEMSRALESNSEPLGGRDAALSGVAWSSNSDRATTCRT